MSSSEGKSNDYSYSVVFKNKAKVKQYSYADMQDGKKVVSEHKKRYVGCCHALISFRQDQQVPA